MMGESVFDDKSREPTTGELDQALDTSSVLLAGIEQFLRLQFGEVMREWKFFSKKAGWTLRIDITTAADVAVVEELVKIKFAN